MEELRLCFEVSQSPNYPRVSRHLSSAKPSVRAHKGAYNHFISSDKPALIGFDPFILKFKCQWAKLSHTRIQVSGNVIQVILLRLNRPAPRGKPFYWGTHLSRLL
jgi:hypothetical protein